MLLRAGQSPFEPRLVNGARRTADRKRATPTLGGQPRGEPSAGHLDRVWPDTGPAKGAKQIIEGPKTAAGVRTVALPWWLMPELRRHFDLYAEPGHDGRVFVGPKGATPLRPNFTQVWARALDGAGLEGIHIHDLRHTGNHFAAMTGASTRELMGRMGHASMDAALIYQHRTAGRDRAIADGIDVMLTGYDHGPETLVGTADSESGSDGYGHGEGTAANSCENGRCLHGEDGARFGCSATVFVMERVTGIEPALSAWETCRFPRTVLRGCCATWCPMTCVDPG